MALELLTIRPPPNVDFIDGFPGLAPHLPDRPHATVQGTLELRSPSPIKAKWLHIELRKVEHVPGSPPFIDTIGSKPTVLWEPRGSEYGMLQTQDFEFSIRIPESVPPTVVLDNGRAGIRYEILATLCGKGKKGLLRRDTAPHFQKSCEIIMLKHEMHSTWPVYSQVEERRATRDGMMLVVERPRTCLGTGQDSIAMTATLYPDIPVSVKSFELTLIQKIIYPGSGASQTMKKGAPPPPPPHRSTVISEQKRSLPVRIQPGMHQSCELNCMLPPNYNAMSVSTARLIENTYEVQVSCLLDGGNSITVGLPIIISPFPVHYSVDLMPRMGMPPMALDHPSRAQWHLQNAAARPPSAAPSTINQAAGSQQLHDPRLSQIGHGSQNGHPPPRQQKPYQIAERRGGGGGGARQDNSLLGGPPSPVEQQPPSISMGSSINGGTGPQYPMTVSTNGRQATYNAGVGAGPGINEFGQPALPAEQPPVMNTVASNQPGRFAVVNANPRDDDGSPRSSRMPEQYVSAAEEKRRLREQMNEADGYASIPPPGAPPPTVQPTVNGAGGASAQLSDTEQSPKKKNWLSAEEEKKKLYEGAKAKAERIHRSIANRNAANASNTSAAPSVNEPSPKANESFAQKFAEAQNSAPVPPSKVESPTPETRESRKKNAAWRSAEDEKRILYEKAQAKALKTQAQARTASISSGGTPNVARSNSVVSNTGSASGITSPYSYTSGSGLKGADLYKSAFANSKGNAAPVAKSPVPSQAPLTITPPPSSPPITTITPPPPAPGNNGGWLTAEEEKARLRYLAAKQAVERHTAAQDEEYGDGSSAPLSQYASSNYAAHSSLSSPATGGQASWNAPPSSPPPFNPPPASINGTLSPGGYSTNSVTPPLNLGPTPPPPNSEPPPFEPSLGYSHSILPEKEKLRLAYAVQDAAPPLSQGPPDYTAPPSDPPPDFSANERVMTAAEEKARLRAQYASEDTPTTAGSSSYASSAPAYARPPPEAPMSVDGSRQLTAAEEKAFLKAQSAADRPISTAAPLPPPRVKSPPISGGSSISRTPTIPSAVSYLTTGNSSASDDYLRRDPSISQGKQRASDLGSYPASPSLLPMAASPTGYATSPAPLAPPPPPLAPRPPKEYIEQAKVEDAKIRRMTQDVTSISALTQMETPGDGSPQLPPWQLGNGTNGGGFSLGLRPFSPIDLGLDTTSLSQNMYSASQASGTTPRSSVYR